MQPSHFGDPRLHERPERYDGSLLVWRRWRLTMLGWLSGIDSRYGSAFQQAEQELQVIAMSALAPAYVPMATYLYAVLLGLL